MKKVANSKYSLSYHLFDACVVCNGGYYILVSEMLKNWKFSKVSRHYHCRGQQSVRRAAYSLQKVLPTDRKSQRVSKKSQISTEKITKRIMSVWKEKLQTVKIHIQNTLSARLVHWHREHWKVQQRVQGPVSWKSQKAICETTNCWLWKVNLLTCFKGNKKNDCQVWWLKSSLFLRCKGNCDTRKRAPGINWNKNNFPNCFGKTAQHHRCKKIRNSIPLLGAFKSCQHCRMFWGPFLWLWTKINLKIRHLWSSQHQATRTLFATFHRLTFSILWNQSPCLLDYILG